jgi:hypothetical protein
MGSISRERIIDTGDQGIYLVQVAATTEEIEAQISRFEFDLVITFAVLALALVASAAAQLRYGLKPLWQLQEGVAAIRRGKAEKIEGDFPHDLAPLASELNLLIDVNRAVVERARTQVGPVRSRPRWRSRPLLCAIRFPITLTAPAPRSGPGRLAERPRWSRPSKPWSASSKKSMRSGRLASPSRCHHSFSRGTPGFRGDGWQSRR